MRDHFCMMDRRQHQRNKRDRNEQRRAEAPTEAPTRIVLSGLDEADKATVADILGEGDVWAKVGTGDTYWRVVESVLAGVWRLEGSTAGGQTVECVEIGPVPQPILTAAAEQARATIEIPKANAMPV